MDSIKFSEAGIESMDKIFLEALRPRREALDLLQAAPGLSGIGAALIPAETGPDTEKFGSPESKASRAGICPGSSESAGKRKSGGTRKGSRWIRRVSCEAAQAAVRAPCPLRAEFEDLSDAGDAKSRLWLQGTKRLGSPARF
ncbi:MAG: transposase [Deltaproteobacteria bacterium]|jgi:transposase|nr:transposase [Deltaproteobacteria bacterium]